MAKAKVELDKKEARRIVNWFKKTLNIEDWTIKLWVQDEPPGWVDAATDDTAQTATYNQYKKSMIWVSSSRCLDASQFSEPSSPGATLIHEMLHVLAADVGWESADPAPRQNENVWNTLGEALYRLYLHDTKK